MNFRPIALLLGLTLGSAAFADTTPFDLSAGDLTQNWSNAALITANDDWSGVPSIQGYRGDNLTGSTGTDPQTLLAADDPGVVDVVANQGNPDTVTAGGVLEFDTLANPAVALNGSNTADAPYLRLHLNTSGRQDIQVSYNLRDLDGSTDDSVQQYALHFRVGNSGAWTNVPAAYVADASTGPGLATLETPVSVTLPAAANDQAEVQVRIMTSNAPGNDEAVGVDDIVVTSAAMGPVPAILVTPTNGLFTNESGGTATFEVVLGTAPLNDVTIGLSSDDASELSVGVGSLVFTPGNWNFPQSVTATGVDDAVADGNVMVNVVTAPAVSMDPAYSGLNGPDVGIVNQDDETPNLLVSPNRAVVTEGSPATVMISVRASTPPSADVTVNFTASNPAEIAVTPSILIPSGSTAAQMITVSSVDDALLDGDIDSTINVSTATADPIYSIIIPPTILATTVDNEGVGIDVTPTMGLVTTEAGGTDSFDVVLTGAPTADVNIAVSSSNPAEGTPDTAMLVFTMADWFIPQTVTVTGVDDDIDDGDQAYQIVLAAATSADPGYNGFDADDVMVTNTDDDTAGVIVSPIMGLITTEAGGTDTFDIVLNSEPIADVSIGISSNDLTEGTVSVATVTFTNGNWDTPQTVTVTGVDDGIDDGDVAYMVITAAIASTDGQYNGINPDDVAVTNLDDDAAGITVTPTMGLVTTEAGGTDTFDVVLNSEPSADVSIGISSSDPTEGTASVATVTFNIGNWDTPQTVTVTGVDDAAVDGDIAYTIVTAAATSADAGYNGIDPADVGVTNTDDDNAGLSINDVSVTEGTGGTTTATFTVSLDVGVDGGFSVDFATADGTATAPADYASNSGTLNFAGNPGETQTINVSIVTDSTFEPDETYTVNLSNPSNPAVLLTDASGLGTIVDDDSADLAIVMTAAPDPVTAGLQLVYTATVSNAGPAAASGVSVSLSLPAGASFVSGSVSDGGTCAGAGPVICNFASNLLSGANGSVTVTVAVPPSALAALQASATVSSATTDPNAANDTANLSTTVVTSADLVFALSVIPQEGVVGDFFDLVATSRNDGPSDAQDAQIDVNVPLGMQLLTRSPSPGGACADLATAAGTTLTCTWAGATAPGTTHSVNAVVQAVSVGQIRVSGSTSSATADPVADNNAATVTVSAGVLPVPALQPVWLLAMTLLLLGLGGLAVRQRS
ncbi:MAG: Calx-beta domain-containing protein [Lysobacterales bacterium]